MLRRSIVSLGLLLLLAAPAGSEKSEKGSESRSEPLSEPETIWLRGRGSDVWIERSPAREARAERKGLTRVVTSPLPAVRAGARDAGDGEHRVSAVRVLDGPHWTHEGHRYEHDHSPRYYYSRTSYRLHPSSHRPSHRYGYGHFDGGRSFYPGYPYRHDHRGRDRHRRLGSGYSGRPSHRGEAFGGQAYRNAGPYGGGVRSGGFVERGGAIRRVR